MNRKLESLYDSHRIDQIRKDVVSKPKRESKAYASDSEVTILQNSFRSSRSATREPRTASKREHAPSPRWNLAKLGSLPQSQNGSDCEMPTRSLMSPRTLPTQ
mmetsp:Transcript_15555/g.27337  ORF Transcript_15555/g.27337 Transcript_15555/m.27337 type:complete len:103 (+) Transcript_15555:149-457(+)